jgi:hypothetical protein
MISPAQTMGSILTPHMGKKKQKNLKQPQAGEDGENRSLIHCW